MLIRPARIMPPMPHATHACERIVAPNSCGYGDGPAARAGERVNLNDSLASSCGSCESVQQLCRQRGCSLVRSLTLVPPAVERPCYAGHEVRALGFLFPAEERPKTI